MHMDVGCCHMACDPLCCGSWRALERTAGCRPEHPVRRALDDLYRYSLSVGWSLFGLPPLSYRCCSLPSVHCSKESVFIHRYPSSICPNRYRRRLFFGLLCTYSCADSDLQCTTHDPNFECNCHRFRCSQINSLLLITIAAEIGAIVLWSSVLKQIVFFQ